MTKRTIFPPRPGGAFRVGCVQWNIDNAANHARAGFAPISDENVRAHYFRYLEFLQLRGLAVKTLVSTVADITPDTALWSTDLTPAGYRFIQFSHDRWISRIRKFSDTPKELAYLDKWLKAFHQLPQGTFDVAE